MRLRSLLALALAMVPCATLPSQEEAPRRLTMRVSSSAAGAAVVVDRGKRDRLEVGDEVRFSPRGGGSYTGVVTKVDERSSVVEMTGQGFVPQLGTRGEAMLPASRFAPKQAEPVIQGEGGQQASPERWKNQDEEFEEGMPLLAQVKPVRPDERVSQMHGRFYAIANLVHVPTEGTTNSLIRTGADLNVDNPFGKGGGIRANLELAILADQADQMEFDVLPRRLSYFRGGDRFSRSRWEVGRFLQYGMPEFGILDGVEWGVRSEGGHRLGASLGFMPELDQDFKSFNDVQVAAHYMWAADQQELLTFGGGFQKSWHNGRTDRDLLVLKARYLPEDGWDLSGVAWIDFYYGNDQFKENSFELTQATVQALRSWETGSGLRLTFTHTAFPELLRNGEFLPIFANEIADNRYDRLALEWWRVTETRAKIHGHLSGWDDEDGSGGAADFGIEFPDWFANGSQTDLVLFGVNGQFTSDVGGRVIYGADVESGRWDFLYELAFRHNQSFASDVGNFLQHRVRISRSVYSGDWDINLHVDGYIWDDDIAGGLGFHLQRSF